MAVRKFILVVGQSNAMEIADAMGWEDLHPYVALRSSTNDPGQTPDFAGGGNANRTVLSLPYTFAGGAKLGWTNSGTQTNEWQIPNTAGRASQALKYLTFYNPVASRINLGFSWATTYPGEGTIRAGSTTTVLFTSVYWQYSPQGLTIRRQRTGQVYTIAAQSNPGWGPGRETTFKITTEMVPPPEDGEVFTYPLVQTIDGGTNDVWLKNRFGGITDLGTSLDSPVITGATEGTRHACQVGAAEDAIGLRITLRSRPVAVNQRIQFSDPTLAQNSYGGALNGSMSDTEIYSDVPHNVSVGDPIVFSHGDGMLPTGVLEGITYYVFSISADKKTIEISTDPTAMLYGTALSALDLGEAFNAGTNGPTSDAVDWLTDTRWNLVLSYGTEYHVVRLVEEREQVSVANQASWDSTGYGKLKLPVGTQTFISGEKVILTGALPAELSENTPYYVNTHLPPDANHITFHDTPMGRGILWSTEGGSTGGAATITRLESGCQFYISTVPGGDPIQGPVQFDPPIGITDIIQPSASPISGVYAPGGGLPWIQQSGAGVWGLFAGQWTTSGLGYGSFIEAGFQADMVVVLTGWGLTGNNITLEIDSIPITGYNGSLMIFKNTVAHPTTTMAYEVGSGDEVVTVPSPVDTTPYFETAAGEAPDVGDIVKLAGTYSQGTFTPAFYEGFWEVYTGRETAANAFYIKTLSGGVPLLSGEAGDPASSITTLEFTNLGGTPFLTYRCGNTSSLMTQVDIQFRGSLTGLQIRCTSGANVGATRDLADVLYTTSTNNNPNKTVLRVGTPWNTGPLANDTYVIEPPDSIPFRKWATWLPWCPFEGEAFYNGPGLAGVSATTGTEASVTVVGISTPEVGTKVRLYSSGLLPSPLDVGRDYYVQKASGATIFLKETYESTDPIMGDTVAGTTSGVAAIVQVNQEGKTNPFPPGFNYPNHLTTPQLYQPYDGPSLLATSPRTAFHVQLGYQLYDNIGEMIHIAVSAVRGSSIGHKEVMALTDRTNMGWLDTSQMKSWAPGEPSNCFSRTMDVLDSVKTAFAKQGDTGECLGIFFAQGEEDARWLSLSGNYEHSARRLKTELRDAIKDRSLTSGLASSIPFIHPQISSQWTYAKEVNTAITKLCDEDAYALTFDVSDFTFMDDGVHYDGKSVSLMGDRAYASWASLQRTGYSQVQICNMALAYIGDKGTITSVVPSDGSRQSTLCNQFYDLALNATLQRHPWDFSVRRTSPTSVTVDRTEWLYSYYLPRDFVGVLAVLPKEPKDDTSYLGHRTSIEYSIDPDSSQVRRLYCNQADVVLRYHAKVVDPTQYTDLFVQALAWKLASLLAGPLVKGEAGVGAAGGAHKMFEAMLAQAAGFDAVRTRERRLKDNTVAEWDRARGNSLDQSEWDRYR